MPTPVVDLSDALAIMLASTQLAGVLDVDASGDALIYPDEAPRSMGAAQRYIVHKLIDAQEGNNLSGRDNLFHARVQLDCAAPTFTAAKLIRNVLLSAPSLGGVQGFTGTVATTPTPIQIVSCFSQGEKRSVEPEPSDENLLTFLRILDFEVWYYQSPAAT